MAFSAAHTVLVASCANQLANQVHSKVKQMVTHFKVSGGVEFISVNEASERMLDEKDGWIFEECQAGKLYTENLKLVFLGDYGLRAQSAKYNTSASLVYNHSASQSLGFDVFGDCFLVSHLAQSIDQ